MSAQPIDYVALAKQAGAISSAPPPSGVDYAALAKQAGAVNSTPARSQDDDLTRMMGQGMPTPDDLAGKTSVTPDTPGPSFGETTKQFGKELLTSLRKTAFYKPSEGESAAHYEPAEAVVGSMVKSGSQAVDQAKRGQYGQATVSGLSALNPFAAPAVSQINELEEQGRGKEATQRGILNAALLAAPFAPKVARTGLEGLEGIDAPASTPPEPAPVAARGIASSSFVPDLKAKAGELGKLAGREVTGRIPIVNRFESLRKPTFGEYADAFKAKADPQLDLFNATPKLGDSPLFSTADQPSLQSGNVRSTPNPAEPTPSPYRLSGNQITDATTVTPKPVFKPAGLLTEGTPAEAAPKAQRGITQGKAPYVPGAVMEPAPFLTMHGAETGETAALMQLTHTGGQALRRIATARGLKIPAASDNLSIIQKIHDDLSPEEIQSFGDAAQARAQERTVSLEGVDPAIVSDNRAIAQKLYSKADEMQAAGESPYKIRAWRTAGESIETRPTPVKDILGDTNALKTIRGVDSKMAQHIQDVTGSGEPPASVPPPPAGTPPQAAPAVAMPPRGITQPPPTPPEAPQPQLATEANTEDLLRKSLAQRGITQGSPPGIRPTSTAPPAGGFSAAPQGGHAGNAVSSVEELSRPGTNYVVSKSGALTYHGKSFAPESIPSGSTHVTALPDGTLRVNAGPKLNPAQELALRKALPKQSPRGITQPVELRQ